MLIQALAEYADTRLGDQLNDPAFELAKVRFLLNIGHDGRFAGFVEPTESAKRGNKTVSIVPERQVPKSPVARNSAVHPLPACDDMRYVLGPGPWTNAKDLANQQERHDAFVALLGRVAGATGDAELAAAVRFYDRPDQLEAARADLASRKPAAGDRICLYVDGPLTSNASVRAYWSAHYRSAFGERSQKSAEGTCLITGMTGPILATHDKIKGLGNLGGQAAGVSLMSFDKAAFRSYGWDKCANSPVSPSRAAAYVLALNDLLKSGSRHRRDHAGIGFVYWTKAAPNDDTFDLIERAEPEQVSRLMQLDERAVDDPDQFYFLGLAGNGGRLMVRHWYFDSLAHVKGNVKAWFEGLRITNAFTGRIADPPPLWQLLKAVARDEPPPGRALELVQRALEGQPLGRSLLTSALDRLRAARKKERFNPYRAGLIRLCTNDITRIQGTTPMSETLDSGQTNAAYLCGRLLAIYDALQFQAQGDVNMTVADRYYSLASVNPMAAFPRVDDLGQKHLRKLRREKRGVMIAVEREIQQIHRLLAHECGARFPGPLTLEDQGRFAIGFHHQRAESMARAAARKQETENSEEK